MNYFAVIRLVRNDSPMKLEFFAQDATAAMKEMLRGAGCLTTNELKEFELYEVLTNGRQVVGYRPVANRRQRDKALPYVSPPASGTAMAIVPKESVTQAVAKVFTEAAYTPYQLVK